MNGARHAIPWVLYKRVVLVVALCTIVCGGCLNTRLFYRKSKGEITEHVNYMIGTETHGFATQKSSNIHGGVSMFIFVPFMF